MQSIIVYDTTCFCKSLKPNVSYSVQLNKLFIFSAIQNSCDFFKILYLFFHLNALWGYGSFGSNHANKTFLSHTCVLLIWVRHCKICWCFTTWQICLLHFYYWLLNHIFVSDSDFYTWSIVSVPSVTLWHNAYFLILIFISWMRINFNFFFYISFY